MSLYPRTLRVMVLIVALVGNACSGVPDDSPLATLSPTVPPARPTPTVLPSDLAAEPTAAPTPSPTPTPAPSDPLEEGLGHAPVGQTEIALVLSITDGDTIRVDRGRGSEPLRYIGIDSPERLHPDRPVEEMAREATEFNRSLVEGREVVLERDASETDRFDRLLRYVWLHEGDEWVLVNLVLVAEGYAQAVTYPPDVRYTELFLAAQREAREAGRGLWRDDFAATPEPTAPPESTPAPDDRAGCDPAYPTVCIPPPPPDLDCADIAPRDFAVLPPDPHNFDGNHDGEGCEGQ